MPGRPPSFTIVATPISIWLNAQRDRSSAFWIVAQLGSSSSVPPR